MKIGKVRFFSRFNERGFGLIVTALLAACAALSAAIGIVYSLGFSDDAREYQRIHRQAMEAASDPTSTPVELNGHLNAVRNALSKAASSAPPTTTVKPWLAFDARVNPNAMQTAASKSNEQPLTVFNLTDRTGRECGAKPVAIAVTVDGRGLGAVRPGGVVSTVVSRGSHTVVGCFPSGGGCPAVKIVVPKQTAANFFWICRSSYLPDYGMTSTVEAIE